MDYFFKALMNTKVESVYLHKQNDVVMALYNQSTLIGGLLYANSPLDLSEYIKHLYSIFPENKNELPLYKCFNPSVTYANDGWGKFLHNEELPITNDGKKRKKNFISKPLLCVEPIITHFKKSNVYIAALYWHQYLVGLCNIQVTDNSKEVSLKDFIPYLYTVFPKDINNLDDFVERNTAIEYYYNDEMYQLTNSQNDK